MRPRDLQTLLTATNAGLFLALRRSRLDVVGGGENAAVRADGGLCTAFDHAEGPLGGGRERAVTAVAVELDEGPVVRFWARQ